jgi:YD repeat-containing protein
LNSDLVCSGWDEANGQGRIKQIKGGAPGSPTSLQNLSYTYDLVGNVMTIVDTKAGGTQTQTFGYDAADRLVSASAAGGSGGTYSETYGYNSTNGNPSLRSGQALNNKAGGMQTYRDNNHKHAVTWRGGDWTYSIRRAAFRSLSAIAFGLLAMSTSATTRRNPYIFVQVSTKAACKSAKIPGMPRCTRHDNVNRCSNAITLRDLTLDALDYWTILDCSRKYQQCCVVG